MEELEVAHIIPHSLMEKGDLKDLVSHDVYSCSYPFISLLICQFDSLNTSKLPPAWINSLSWMESECKSGRPSSKLVVTYRVTQELAEQSKHLYKGRLTSGIPDNQRPLTVLLKDYFKKGLILQNPSGVIAFMDLNNGQPREIKIGKTIIRCHQQTLIVKSSL